MTNKAYSGATRLCTILQQVTGFTSHSGWGERELKFQHVATKFSCLNLQAGFLPLKADSKCSWFNFGSFIHLIPLGHRPASRWQMVLAFALTEGFVVPLLATQKDFSTLSVCTGLCEIWRVYISILWIQSRPHLQVCDNHRLLWEYLKHLVHIRRNSKIKSKGWSWKHKSFHLFTTCI